MRFNRSMQVSPSIPTASMGDIVMLLLIFFMATTVFGAEQGLPITLPRAESGLRVPEAHTTHVWVNPAFEITIDDVYLSLEEAEQVLRHKVRANPHLIVGVNIDSGLPYEQVDLLLRALREANALNVTFTNMRETAGGQDHGL